MITFCFFHRYGWRVPPGWVRWQRCGLFCDLYHPWWPGSVSHSVYSTTSMETDIIIYALCTIERPVWCVLVCCVDLQVYWLHHESAMYLRPSNGSAANLTIQFPFFSTSTKPSLDSTPLPMWPESWTWHLTMSGMGDFLTIALFLSQVLHSSSLSFRIPSHFSLHNQCYVPGWVTGCGAYKSECIR